MPDLVDSSDASTVTSFGGDDLVDSSDESTAADDGNTMNTEVQQVVSDETTQH